MNPKEIARLITEDPDIMKDDSEDEMIWLLVAIAWEPGKDPTRNEIISRTKELIKNEFDSPVDDFEIEDVFSEGLTANLRVNDDVYGDWELSDDVIKVSCETPL